MKTKTIKIIDVEDFDNLVIKTYGRHYNFQQQDGCKSRGTKYITVPEKAYGFKRDTLPEKVNHPTMGVSFEAWMKRDPSQSLSDPNSQNSWSLELWWERNFYPDVQEIVNDLHAKGLLEAGEYGINIDW
jgi:hypothetical protein